MKRSTERILTTHTGSLPRPPDLTAALARRDRGERVDGALDALIRAGVSEVVRRQVDAGVDVVNDGEASKLRYATYVKERLDGFGGESRSGPPHPAVAAFPEYYASKPPRQSDPLPACVGPLAYRDQDAVQTDIANLKAALADADVADAFMSAASPGIVAASFENQHYPSHEAYLFALADTMKVEYDAIHSAGFVLQLDCPDLAGLRHQHPGDDAGFRRSVKLHLDAVDHATRDVPAQEIRLHLCWGNSEDPHTHDVPLREFLDLVLAARPTAISFEGANPRHAHEWAVFKDVALPEDKVLIPGVLDSTTNYVEHPELVAQRIVQYASLVGRERVIAGSDCGFATTATHPTVHPSITWAKLAAMAEGARLASAQLWS